jgi:hypothetical protein
MSLFPTGTLTAAQLTIQWDDNSRTELGFKIERSTNGKTFSTVATVRANQTSYTDKGVSPATTYWYRVKAYDLLRSSGYSNVTSAKTPAAPSPTQPLPNSGSVGSTPKPTETAKPPATTPTAPKPAPTNPAPPLPIAAGRIRALTGRAVAGSSDPQSLVLSFTVTGKAKEVLLRGMGPGLGSYTTAKVLSDPKLKLTSGSTVLATNDNWGGNPLLSILFEDAGALPFSGTSKDVAMVTVLSPNSYTTVVNGSSTGLAQTEIYDTDTLRSSMGRLSKLSLRAPVQTGSSVLVGGFVVVEGPVRVLIRAIGPGVAGLSGLLKDPKLSIHRGNTAVASNDNWGGGSSLAAAFKQVGAASLPASSKDSAILTTLSPGTYTATVSGVSNTVGIARLELYVMP